MTTIFRGRLSGYGYLPPGGETGQTLIKISDVDGDCDWATVESLARFELDNYGGAGDYSSASEPVGQDANSATDNRPAFVSLINDVTENGGGVIAVSTPGEYWLSNSLPTIETSNTFLYLAPGATLISTTPTSFGALVHFSSSDPENSPLKMVGVYGGGRIRVHCPDTSQLSQWSAETEFGPQSYCWSTDENGDKRAYYTENGGTTGTTAPTAINGSSNDGGVVWRDAHNDNGIGITASGFFIDNIYVESASDKGITVQTPNWSGGVISRVRIGTTHHDGIEIKGNQGTSDSIGRDTIIRDCLIEDAGGHGFNLEQPGTGSPLSSGLKLVDSTVLSCGRFHSDHGRGTGIRANKCRRPVVRGNLVYSSQVNGYHFRLCEQIVGDIYTESSCPHGFGVHLQQNSGFSFTDVVVTNAATSVRENGDKSGGFIGRLVVGGSIGYHTSGRAGSPPVIASHNNTATTQYSGTSPTLLS